MARSASAAARASSGGRPPEAPDPRWLDVVDQVARASLGRDDLRGPALAAEVARVSRAYTRERGAAGALRDAPRTAAAHAARLRFFLPRDLAKVGLHGVGGPLHDLRASAAIPAARVWRVLDLGAGLGTTSLGVAAFARASGAADVLDVTALDDDPRALALFERLAAATAPGGAAEALAVPVALRPRPFDLAAPGAEARVPEGPFDLVVAGLVLNELFAQAPAAEALARRAALVRALLRRLAPDGVLLVVEPALRETSRALHALRDAALAPGPPDAAPEPTPHVLYPCTHTRPCPMLRAERDWCHDELPVALPPPLADVARDAGLRFEGLSFSALALGLRPRAHPPGAVRVVSDVLASKGKREVFVCGADGRVRLDVLDRDVPRGAADPLEGARRGALLALPDLALDARDAGSPVRRARLRP